MKRSSIRDSIKDIEDKKAKKTVRRVPDEEFFTALANATVPAKTMSQITAYIYIEVHLLKLLLARGDIDGAKVAFDVIKRTLDGCLESGEISAFDDFVKAWSKIKITKSTALGEHWREEIFYSKPQPSHRKA